jgi:hypothetical protein
MEAQDKAALAKIIKEYPIREWYRELEKAIYDQEDYLVDHGMNDKVKPLSLVAWHLSLINFND